MALLKSVIEIRLDLLKLTSSDQLREKVECFTFISHYVISEFEFFVFIFI